MCGRENFGGIAFIAMIWRQALKAFNTVQVEKGAGEKLGITQQFWGVIQWYHLGIMQQFWCVIQWCHLGIMQQFWCVIQWYHHSDSKSPSTK
jgi:hypothetical protein